MFSVQLFDVHTVGTYFHIDKQDHEKRIFYVFLFLFLFFTYSTRNARRLMRPTGMKQGSTEVPNRTNWRFGEKDKRAG